MFEMPIEGQSCQETTVGRYSRYCRCSLYSGSAPTAIFSEFARSAAFVITNNKLKVRAKDATSTIFGATLTCAHSVPVAQGSIGIMVDSLRL